CDEDASANQAETIVGDGASDRSGFWPVVEEGQYRWLPPNPAGLLVAFAFGGLLAVLSGEAFGVDLKGRTPLLLAPPLAEHGDIFLPRKEELQEADTAVLARLVDAQEDEVIRQPSLRQLAVRDPAVVGERLDRVLGVVVVPGHAVVAEECEELRLVLEETLLVALRQFRPVDAGLQSTEEPTDLGLV